MTTPATPKYRALTEEVVLELMQYFHKQAKEVDLYLKVSQALHVNTAETPAHTTSVPAATTPVQGTTPSN